MPIFARVIRERSEANQLAVPGGAERAKWITANVRKKKAR